MTAMQNHEYIQAGLSEHGCDTVPEWLMQLSEEYGVPYEHVKQLAQLLGPGELFDGLITSVQDAAGEY